MFNVQKQKIIPNFDDIVSVFQSSSRPRSYRNCIPASSFKGKSLVLYGAGSGFDTFSTTVLKPFSLAPNFIIDEKFQESDQFYRGIPARHPSSLEIAHPALGDLTFVITIGKVAFYEQAKKFLIEIGAKNIVSAFEIFEFHLIASGELQDPGSNDFFVSNRTRICAAYKLLADEESRQVYRGLLATYVFREIFDIPARAINLQYLPLDIPLSKGFTSVIDCGAFDGTISRRLFDASEHSMRSLFCFEPDLANFLKLTNNLRLGFEGVDIYLFPLALSNADKHVTFENNYNVNSHISSDVDGQGTLAVSFDSIFPTLKPSLIKMDIEGAELDALRGACSLIRRARPDLAVSVYHKPSHLWEIICFVNALGLSYKFYLRNYTTWVPETVLYATV